MFVLANLMTAVAQIIDIVLSIYMWIIIIRALISWVNPDPHNPIVQLLYKLTEPVLYQIRRLVPAYGYGIDLSPLIALLVVIFLKAFLVASLYQLAQRMRLAG
jgi:YggT family protein